MLVSFCVVCVHVLDVHGDFIFKVGHGFFFFFFDFFLGQSCDVGFDFFVGCDLVGLFYVYTFVFFIFYVFCYSAFLLYFCIMPGWRILLVVWS